MSEEQVEEMATVLIVDGEETEELGGTQNYMEGPEGLVDTSLLFLFLLFVKHDVCPFL